MKKMILKIKRRFYYRRLLRLYFKGMKIQQNLTEWGCDDLTCCICPYNKDSNACGIKNDMNVWSQKMDKALYKYQDCEIALEKISDGKIHWLIDSIEINSDGQIVKNGFNNKLGGTDNEQKAKKVQTRKKQEKQIS